MTGRTKTQREKFEQAARELEADDSEEAFDAKLRQIAKVLPPKDKTDASKASKG